MKLTDNQGIVWQVHFHHEHLNPPRRIGLLLGNPTSWQRALVTDITTATIHRAKSSTPLAWHHCTVPGTGCKGAVGAIEHGEAHCSERDEFRKDVGRKLALADAMQRHPELTGEQHYEQRRALWLDYLTKTRLIVSVPGGAA